MNRIFRWSLTHRLHYKGRTAAAVFICGFLMFIAAASAMLMNHMAEQSQKPMKALNTELIIQKQTAQASPSGFKTGGIITPFNLQNFQSDESCGELRRLDYVSACSSALILWNLDTKGTLVIAGIKKNDPKAGLRTIESMLMSGSFFSSDSADEVILERHYAAFFGHKLNMKYSLNEKEFKIVGIVDFVNQSNLNTASVFMPYETAVRLGGLKNGDVNQAYVALKSSSDIERLQKEASALLQDFRIITKDNLYKNLKGLNGIMLTFGSTVTAVLSAVSALLVVFLLKIHSYDFKRNADTLRMLGWKKNLCRQWLIADTAIILLCAAALCLLLVLVFSYAVLPAVNITPPSVQELVL